VFDIVAEKGESQAEACLGFTAFPTCFSKRENFLRQNNFWKSDESIVSRDCTLAFSYVTLGKSLNFPETCFL